MLTLNSVGAAASGSSDSRASLYTDQPPIFTMLYTNVKPSELRKEQGSELVERRREAPQYAVRSLNWHSNIVRLVGTCVEKRHGGRLRCVQPSIVCRLHADTSCTHAHTRARTHTHTNTHTFIYMYMYLYVCI